MRSDGGLPRDCSDGRPSLGVIQKKTVFMTIALLVFLGSAILGTAFAGFVVWGLCCFVAVSVLYGFLVGSHFFNEVEAALVCELLLIPTLLIIRICLRS